MNCRIAVIAAGLFSIALSFCVGAAISEELGANPSQPGPAARADALRKQAKPYFVEFRARAAHSYGHTFAVYGRVGQKITASQVVGLHPATESTIPWMIGHLIAVPSETGASDGDIEDQYIIARYRILLTEQEYRRLVAHMKKMQASSPVWHAVLYNCNAFVADIAKYMGLKTPSSTLLMPKDFIAQLRALNAGATSQKHAVNDPEERDQQKPAKSSTAAKRSAPANEVKRPPST